MAHKNHLYSDGDLLSAYYKQWHTRHNRSKSVYLKYFGA
ncbi:hypothetical protein BOVAC1_2851 [Bacteroides ovatus]|nr:hypothetical protein BOVAC1_2851 [Bacteroides ovatus]